MRVIGKITRSDMAQMQRRGLGPKQAVDAVVAEAKRRFEGATVVLRPEPDGGFAIVAL